ncbi:hypothetical protein E3U55_07455 [Filobacillus milosensis]|uniref:Lipoprotein n=1 Tax=Filobacillus milosensis TaxID=94137 RepID=A0A4Y8INN7_9BACI|nr:hypothetical protein [Filobacillus milosensis]TFB22130.1 hypothetical protein E3U55_07455 [Filobacillus milosensis]
MKFYASLFMVIIFLITGCTYNETVTIKGKINDVNKKENTFVVYVGDNLTEKQRQRMEYDEDDKFIEAFSVETTNDTVIKGEVNSFNELRMGQKVSIELKGHYDKDLVTIDTLFEQQENLPTYQADGVTIVPYTKKELVDEMTVDKGYYGLYIYNAKEDKSYSNLNDQLQLKRMVISRSNGEGGVKNMKELLDLYNDSTTFIITDDKGIVYKTDKEKELIEFINKLNSKKATK